MDTTALFLFLVFFVLGYAVREFIGGSKKDKSKQDSKGDTVLQVLDRRAKSPAR